MLPFLYHRVSRDETYPLEDNFIGQHGDYERGLIADAEFDRLFDHLAEALRRHGTFTEESDPSADFAGSRYEDQIPFICTVARNGVSPAAALEAALEAVAGAHRPLAVAFDLYPDKLLVLPPNRVYTTFGPEVFTTPKA